LALVENTLKHWNAVSENFPPTDRVSQTYHLKAELQIARLRMEGEDFSNAEMHLRTVINSPYADDVLRTIARIELGWISQRGKRDSVSNEHYEKAIRELSTMEPDKQKLIRDALPARVRTDWENVDYLHQEEAAPPADTNAGGGDGGPTRSTRGLTGWRPHVFHGSHCVPVGSGTFSDCQAGNGLCLGDAVIATQREGLG
jgi:hypothetical protein